MVRKIGSWALSGAAVAIFWFFFFTWLTWGAYHGGPAFNFSTFTQILVDITIPIRPLFGWRHAIPWYWSVVLNAGIYACVGLIVETVSMGVRWRLAHARH